MRTSSFRLPAATLGMATLLVVGSLLLAGACASGASDSVDQTPPTADEEEPLLPLDQRFEGGVADVLIDLGLADEGFEPDITIVEETIGLADGDPPWYAHGFPDEGLPVTRHTADLDLPDDVEGHFFLVLHELEVPPTFGVCEAPWDHQPHAQQPCRAETIGDDFRLATTEYGNLRKIVLVGADWAVSSSVYVPLDDGDEIPELPIDMSQHRSVVRAIADRLAPEGMPSQEDASWEYRLPASSVTVQLPNSWDVRNGVVLEGEDHHHNVYLGDTTPGNARQVFLTRDAEDYEDSWGVECRVLESRVLPSDSDRELVLSAHAQDLRYVVGKVGFNMFLSDWTGEEVPCGTGRGVAYDGGTMRVSNSLQFDTFEEVEEWVASADFEAVADVMATLNPQG